MRREPKRLIDGALVGDSVVELYIAQERIYTTISAMTATNTSNAVVDLTVYLVPAESTPEAANAVLWKRNLAPGESRVIGEGIAQTIHPLGTIQAAASAAGAISLVASGYETIA
nr:hypothetical protein [Alcaligenes faecalis]